MLICMPKIHSIVHFDVYLHAKNTLHCWLLSWDITFYLQFDWPTAFWPVTGEQEFCQIWDWWTILVFILDYSQEKVMTKFFKEILKNIVWVHFWTLFCLNLSKNEFSWKTGSVCFYSYYLLSCEKCLTDWRTDRWKTVILKDPQQEGGPMKHYYIFLPWIQSHQLHTLYMNFVILPSIKAYHNFSKDIYLPSAIIEWKKSDFRVSPSYSLFKKRTL